ncbi:MAG: hypothetical protein ACI81V_001002 [Lentimonas sp.]|jgi:hypothetical protein
MKMDGGRVRSTYVYITLWRHDEYLSCRWGDYFVRLVVWTPPARSIQWAFGYDAFASGDRNGFQDLIGEAQSHSLPFFFNGRLWHD